jgi:hypothetical protein
MADFKKFDLTKHVPITYGNSTGVAAQAGDEPMRLVSANLLDRAVALLQSSGQMGVAHQLKECASPRATADVEREKLPHGHRDDFYLMANARSLAMNSIHTVRSMPNWVLAMKLFATGSTSAREICARAGIDPDGISIERATTKPGA